MLIGLQMNIPKFHLLKSVLVCALGRHIMDKISYIRRLPLQKHFLQLSSKEAKKNIEHGDSF